MAPADPGPVPEAPLEQHDEGLYPTPPGWFVMNATEARWRHKPGRGHSVALTGMTDEECETHYTDLGVNLLILEPGEPVGIYHWEADSEGFLVLFGEPLLIVEGEERPLRRWDFVYCPPGTRHVIVGAGDGPSGILAMGARNHIGEFCNGGGYVADETATRYGASVAGTDADATAADATLPETEIVPYRDGWLPGD